MADGWTDGKVCRPSYYSHGFMEEKLRNNFLTTATQLDGGPRHGRREVIGQVPYAKTHVSHCAFQ